MSIMLKEKRATRGKRMTALIGKAAEEDESFSEDNKDEPDEVIYLHIIFYYILILFYFI